MFDKILSNVNYRNIYKLNYYIQQYLKQKVRFDCIKIACYIIIETFKYQ
jgi:hypothetical protein